MKIHLRPVELKDGRTIVNWRNDPLVRAHCRSHNPITEEINERFFHDFVETGKYRQYMVERIDEDYYVFSYSIATIYLKDIDYTTKSAELCLFTSNDREWNAESQTLAIQRILEIAFDELKLQTVNSYVFNRFIKEAEVLKQFGFSLDCENKDNLLKDEDVIKFSLIYNDWKK